MTTGVPGRQNKMDLSNWTRWVSSPSFEVSEFEEIDVK